MKFPSYKNQLQFCDACKLGKLYKLPFQKYHVSVTKPLKIVYTDLWDTSPYLSLEGHSFYLIFIDAYSRFIWLYQLKHKSEPNQFPSNSKPILSCSLTTE